MSDLHCFSALNITRVMQKKNYHIQTCFKLTKLPCRLLLQLKRYQSRNLIPRLGCISRAKETIKSKRVGLVTGDSGCCARRPDPRKVEARRSFSVPPRKTARCLASFHASKDISLTRTTTREKGEEKERK